MKIGVMGTGGVGGYYGALLAQRKHDVIFIARGAHLRAIQANGLLVKTPSGDLLIKPAHATDKPAKVGSVDLVLFCTKTYDTVPAAEQAKPLVGPTTTVVSLQNGIDAHEQIGKVIGAEHVIAGVTGIISRVDSPGIIRFESKVPWIAVGELDGRRTPRVEAVCSAFDETGVEIEISENIMGDLWEKLVLVAPLFGFGSLTRLPVDLYRSVPETRVLITRLMQETAAVAAADHVTLDPLVVENTLARVDQLPPLWKSSMQRDVEAGRSSELEATIGAICRKGSELGVATPVAAMVYGALLPVDLTARGEQPSM
jgi:2-dehydropantoate 2-reductase